VTFFFVNRYNGHYIQPPTEHASIVEHVYIDLQVERIYVNKQPPLARLNASAQLDESIVISDSEEDSSIKQGEELDKLENTSSGKRHCHSLVRLNTV
jgi:hypothetical protein